MGCGQSSVALMARTCGFHLDECLDGLLCALLVTILHAGLNDVQHARHEGKELVPVLVRLELLQPIVESAGNTCTRDAS